MIITSSKREKEISHDDSWGGVGEWVEVWGVELYRPGIFIYIYKSEPPPRLRGGDVETLGCNGMTGC